MTHDASPVWLDVLKINIIIINLGSLALNAFDLFIDNDRADIMTYINVRGFSPVEVSDSDSHATEHFAPVDCVFLLEVNKILSFLAPVISGAEF